MDTMFICSEHFVLKGGLQLHPALHYIQQNSVLGQPKKAFQITLSRSLCYSAELLTFPKLVPKFWFLNLTSVTDMYVQVLTLTPYSEYQNISEDPMLSSKNRVWLLLSCPVSCARASRWANHCWEQNVGLIGPLIWSSKFLPNVFYNLRFSS